MSAKPKVLPLQRPGRRPVRTRAMPRWLLLGLLALGFSALAMVWAVFGPVSVSDDIEMIHVSPKPSAMAVGEDLKAQGIELNPRLFAWTAQFNGVANRLKAGSFEVPSTLSVWGLVKLLSRGDVRYSELAIIEGWSFRRLRDAVDSHPSLRHGTKGMSEAELMAALGLTGRHPEGLFFPDTYVFAHNSDDLAVYRMARIRMEKELEAIWQQRQPDVPLKSPYEALIMASLIEKETGLAADRAHISSVFANRLRRGMMLQTDPSVIYGLGVAFDGDLRKSDLKADTPYNTYTRNGLPPTPIALPGRESLKAAVQPASTPYLYFVARGDGSSHFSSSLDEHNRAVDRFIRKHRKGQ